jgi:ubiquinone/menaquinone biosynthesis C-methylase UbiE
MGQWSLIAGNVFLDWLAPEQGLQWIDIGCGSGAFSELVSQSYAPAELQGVDPSDAQIGFARTRAATRNAVFQVGDAIALPFPADRFDAAVMALVIFFVPDPAKGVAEMARVVRPGGIVAAYAWDNLGGGFPFEPIRLEMRALGFNPPEAPSVGASRAEAMRELWAAAGLEAIETREISVSRSFTDFEDYWTQSTLTGSTRPMIATMQPGEIEQVKAGVRVRMAIDGEGPIVHSARANAVKGRVPR